MSPFDRLLQDTRTEIGQTLAAGPTWLELQRIRETVIEEEAYATDRFRRVAPQLSGAKRRFANLARKVEFWNWDREEWLGYDERNIARLQAHSDLMREIRDDYRAALVLIDTI